VKPYEVSGFEQLFKPSTGDRIIGSKEDQRSTKTFIPSERSAILLSLLENHAHSVAKRVIRLHQEKNGGPELTITQAKELYPGVKKWIELHQELVEHYASQEGFAIQATVSVEKSRLMLEQQQAQSSIKEQKGT
jgi:hypothetical protein